MEEERQREDPDVRHSTPKNANSAALALASGLSAINNPFTEAAIGALFYVRARMVSEAGLWPSVEVSFDSKSIESK